MTNDHPTVSKHVRALVAPGLLCAMLMACSSGDDSGSTANSNGVVTVSGTPTREQLSDALNTFVSFSEKGQWGRVWELLLPEQQAAIPRDKYVSCRSGDNVPNADSITITETYDELTTPPGASAPIDSIAVTIEVRAGGRTETTTAHEFVVDGQLRFSLDEDAFRRCSAA